MRLIELCTVFHVHRAADWISEYGESPASQPQEKQVRDDWFILPNLGCAMTSEGEVIRIKLADRAPFNRAASV